MITNIFAHYIGQKVFVRTKSYVITVTRLRLFRCEVLKCQYLIPFILVTSLDAAGRCRTPDVQANNDRKPKAARSQPPLPACTTPTDSSFTSVEEHAVALYPR